MMNENQPIRQPAGNQTLNLPIPNTLEKQEKNISQCQTGPSRKDQRTADHTEYYAEKSDALKMQNTFNDHIIFMCDMITNLRFRGYNLEQLRADQYECSELHTAAAFLRNELIDNPDPL